MFVGPVILCRSDCIFRGPVDELDCCALALDGNDSGTRHSRGHEDPSIKAKKSSKPCDRASILAVGRRHDCQWTEPGKVLAQLGERPPVGGLAPRSLAKGAVRRPPCPESLESRQTESHGLVPVSYTHIRAHETRHDIVCRPLLEKKKIKKIRRLLQISQ